MLVSWVSSRHASAQQIQDPLEVIPASWLDLPEAPFIAKVVLGRAVLVNRGERLLDSVSTGCVRRDGDKARVLGELFAAQVSDGVYAPGGHVEGLLRLLNKLRYDVEFSAKSFPDLMTQCPADSRFAVTAAAASFSRHRWSAEGTRWPQ